MPLEWSRLADLLRDKVKHEFICWNDKSTEKEDVIKVINKWYSHDDAFICITHVCKLILVRMKMNERTKEEKTNKKAQ